MFLTVEIDDCQFVQSESQKRKGGVGPVRQAQGEDFGRKFGLFDGFDRLIAGRLRAKTLERGDGFGGIGGIVKILNEPNNIR